MIRILAIAFIDSTQKSDIEAVPLEATCERCRQLGEVGRMVRSNQSADQKSIGRFNWHFQVTCDNCGFTRRDHRVYMGRLKRTPPPSQKQLPDVIGQTHLF